MIKLFLLLLLTVLCVNSLTITDLQPHNKVKYVAMRRTQRKKWQILIETTKGHGRLSEIGRGKEPPSQGEKNRAYFCLVRTGKKFFNQVNIVDKLGSIRLNVFA